MLETAITAALLSLPPFIFIKFLDHKLKNISHELQSKTDKNTFKFIFVTHKNRLCSPHLNTRLICGPTCSYLYLKNIVNLINQAKKSVSICMYHLSLDGIYNAVINAHNRGVYVRMISDVVMLSSTGNRVTKLSKSIPAKTQRVNYGLMHHKFMLIDEKNENNQKVLYGSLNYTVNALINNWEFVILTSTPQIVKQFSEEFELLWQSASFVYIGNQ